MFNNFYQVIAAFVFDWVRLFCWLSTEWNFYMSIYIHISIDNFNLQWWLSSKKKMPCHVHIWPIFFPKTMLTLWSLNRMKSPTDVWLPPQLFWHRANLIYSRHLKLVSLILVLNNIINIIRFGTTCKQKIITQRKLQKAQQSRYFDCQVNFSKHW